MFQTDFLMLANPDGIVNTFTRPTTAFTFIVKHIEKVLS